MASLRTTTCVHMVHTCLIITLVFLCCPTDTLTVSPSLDPANSSIIIWGELPPIPTASGGNSTSSRPGLLADMAQGFVDLVQPQGLPYSYIRFTLNETIHYQTNYFSDNINTEVWVILNLFVGIVVCILIGIVYFILVPLVGLIFGCCRCCNNCGGKRVQRETKHMGCMRVTLSLFFFAITGVICAGMAFTNVSNEFISASFTEIKTTGDSSLSDLQSFFTKANEQIDYMVTTEYGFVDALLTQNLQNIGTEIGDPIESYVLDEAGLQDVLDAANSISKILTEMKGVLSESDDLRSALISDSMTLEAELDIVRANLSDINTQCSDCVSNIDTLTLSVDFNQLPTLEDQIQGVVDANNTVVNVTKEVMAVLNDIPDQITTDTSDVVNEALTQLENVEREVTSSVQDVTDQIQNVVIQISNATSDFGKIWTDVENEYSKYVYYSLIGLTCTVLLIVMFNLIGLTMGTFSYKNVGPTERSRMSNAGGNVLIAGVFFTFLFAPILILITCVLFGTFSLTSLTCDPLKTYELLNQTVDQPGVLTDGYYFGKLLLNNASIPLTGSGILSQCEDDRSAYSALMLESLYNLDGIKEKLDILTDEVYKIIGDIGDVNLDFPFTEFINDINGLVNMTDLGSINYTQYETLLNSNITTADLTAFASYLDEVANQQSNTAVASELRAQADELETIQTNIVEPMQMNMQQILDNLNRSTALEEQLQMQIDRTIALINTTETIIESNETADAINDIIAGYANRLIGYGNQFYNEFDKQVTQDFAKCRLLSDVYGYSVDTACDFAVDSGNTLWFTVGWCVFFYVPSIIFAVKLAKYYRIMDEDAPYRAPKSKKKKKQNRRSSDEEMPMDEMRDEGTTGLTSHMYRNNHGHQPLDRTTYVW